MSRVFVSGIGAVSPAGWSVESLRSILHSGQPVPPIEIPRPGWETTLAARVVPTPPARPDFLSHPRLRRSCPLTHYVVAAALEALGGRNTPELRPPGPLGLVVCLLAGNVTYTRRFYEEVMANPATASPMLFPETVFNAPASHLATFLGADHPGYTLVGDDGAFLQGLALAAHWLGDGGVGSCLVIGAEESDWVIADAVRLFQRSAVHGAGAGALLLTREPGRAPLAELAAVTDSFSYAAGRSRRQAALNMRAQLPTGGAEEILCWGFENLPATDAPETEAWPDWPGDRRSPKLLLGRAFNASAAWQCVMACDAVALGQCHAANVSVVGTSQQAIGARFQNPNS